MLGALIGSGIGLAGSLIGGWMQSRAAAKAAEAQKAAAAEAGKLVGEGVNEANAPIGEATANAQRGVTTAANYAVDTAGAGANKALAAAAQANSILDPYATAGGTAADYLNRAVAEGGDFNRKATMADYQMDPSVEWVRQQQEQALARAQSARGGFLSGGAIKDAMNYNYGLSSQEIAKAFDRYQTDTAQRYARLFGTAGMGLDAGTQQVNNLNTAARYAGDINMQGAGLNLTGQTQVGEFGQRGTTAMGDNAMRGALEKADIVTGRGNAEGAAKLASGQAWGSAIANGANTVGNAISNASAYKDLLKTPLYQNPAVVKR